MNTLALLQLPTVVNGGFQRVPLPRNTFPTPVPFFESLGTKPSLIRWVLIGVRPFMIGCSSMLIWFLVIIQHGSVYKLAFGPKAFVVVSDPVVARHILRENAFSYDKGVLAEILEPIMGKGLIPADLDTWKQRRKEILIIILLVYRVYFSFYTDQAVYGTLFEAEHRSTFYIPYWNLPFARWIVPRQRKFHNDLKIINDCLDGLIKNAKETRQEADVEKLQQRDYSSLKVKSMQDISLLRFLVDMRGVDVDDHQVNSARLISCLQFQPILPVPVHQVTGTRTVRYWAVPPKIDRRRSISTVGGRLKKKSIVGGRLREKSIVDGRLRKKKGRRRGKEKKKRRIPRPRPVAARGSPALAVAFSPVRGDGTSPRAGRKIEATYIRLIVVETLRLYPQPPLLIRRSLKADKLPGTFSFLSPYFWDRPNEFEPERFLVPKPSEGIAGWAGYDPGRSLGAMYPNEITSDFAFIPFGGGPRKCVGDQFALLESTIALALLLQKFDVLLRGSPDEVELVTGATIHTKSGLWCKLKKRT
ncbi:hypothetical protein GW17_00021529 [Ensete ventricosum]|nr:hypothetical protein GW17_00021529 [Ensete ventricosum]